MVRMAWFPCPFLTADVFSQFNPAASLEAWCRLPGAAWVAHIKAMPYSQHLSCGLGAYPESSLAGTSSSCTSSRYQPSSVLLILGSSLAFVRFTNGHLPFWPGSASPYLSLFQLWEELTLLVYLLTDSSYSTLDRYEGSGIYRILEYSENMSWMHRK